jgi:hypothetical protein
MGAAMIAAVGLTGASAYVIYGWLPRVLPGG